MDTILLNRQDAGLRLAQKLLDYRQYPQGIVLGLPRGGVPVASVIAQQLQLPLNICLAKKLGSPYNSEVAIGAIADNDIVVIDKNSLEQQQISDDFLSATIKAQRQKLANYQVLSQKIPHLSEKSQYRQNYQLNNSTVILVDDGVATGLTLQAAIATVYQHKVKDLIVAVPVITQNLVALFESEVTKLVYLIAPQNLNAVSFWYQDFSQVTDQEVFDLLQKTNQDYALGLNN